MKYSEVFDMHCNHCDRPLPMIHRFDELPEGKKAGITHPCCGEKSYWRHYIIQRGQPL